MQKLRRLLIYAPLILSMVIVVSVIALFLHQREGMLKVIFLDVGQGDAIFIQTPSKKQILIDAGNGPDIRSELGQVMMPWDRTIDMAIFTHPDKDHIGGAPDVFEGYRIDTVIDNGFDVEKDIVELYHARLDEEGALHRSMRHPDTLMLPDGVRLSFLRTIPTAEANGNEGSLALRLEYGNASFLFTGDAGVGVEFELVKNAYPSMDVDVLKLGHHGSSTSSSELFLKATTPHIAVISAGHNNSYGHPHAEVLERLDFFAIPSVCTCDQGRITFVSDGQVLEMKS